MKQIIIINILIIIGFSLFAQVNNKELIKKIEGDWRFMYSKGPWGVSTPEENGFNEIINFTKIYNQDSLIFSVFIEDTLFHTRTHQVYFDDRDSTFSLVLINNHSDDKLINIISEDVIRISNNMYNGAYLEYKRVESSIVMIDDF